MIKLNLLTSLSVDICFIYNMASLSVDSVSEKNRYFRAFVTFPLQSLGRIQKAVILLGGSAGCASELENSSSLRGPSPQAFTHFGVGGSLPGTWGASIKVCSEGKFCILVWHANLIRHLISPNQDDLSY